MDAARSLVNHVAVLLSSQLITSLLGFLTVVLLPVYLGDAGLGQLAFALSICTVLGAVAVAGTNLYIVREVAANRGRSSQLIAAGLVMRAPVWAVLVVITWVYISLRGTSHQAMVVLAVLFAVTLFNVLNGVLASALQGLEEMRWRSVAAVASSMIVLLAGLPLLVLTHSPVWFCVALLAGAIAGLAVNAFYFIRRRLPLSLPSRGDYREIAIGAMPFLALALSQGLYSQIDTIFMGLMTNDATVGWFAAAARLSTTVLLVPVVMTSALLPVLTRLGAAQPAAAALASRRALQAVLMLAMPLAAGLSAVGQPLFAFLHYPETFSRSIPILIVLSASWVVTAVVMVLACTVVATGRQRSWATASGAMLFLFGALNLGLIPLATRLWSNGGIGAAVANLVGELVFAVVALAIVQERFLGWREALYFARVGLATLGMVVAVRMAGGLSLPLLIAIGALAYGLLSVALRTLTVGDARSVVQLLRKERPAVTTTAPAPIAS
ncbi:MAG: flippase [Chloroflexi bacterium]|nr:MAG: flippase [Chloroflexota bacterium]TME41285.1 MAG: flippase [Chloroflexota bacterium]TME51089.1 MAG: flippase [Chloroflexota bacterium]